MHISYLPLAHIYERVIIYTCIHTGTGVRLPRSLITYRARVWTELHRFTQIGFFRGDVLGLLDDIQALQPTIFVSVPRLWNRIHDRVAAVRAPWLGRARACGAETPCSVAGAA